MFETILLSIIQGVTEFLPISSSAHLIIFSSLTNFHNQNLTMDVSLHLGSLLAIIFFFKKKIFNFIINKPLIIKIIISSLPTIVIGFFFVKFDIIDQFRNIYVIGFSTIIFGLLLYISDKSIIKKNIINDLSIKESLYIGLLQALALIPGVSRSGITLTGARFLKFDRITSAEISFLLSIPTLFAASVYNILKIIKLENIQITTNNFWAIVMSFVFSLITLKFFIKFLKKFSLIFFVIYRFLLGIIILIYAHNI